MCGQGRVVKGRMFDHVHFIVLFIEFFLDKDSLQEIIDGIHVRHKVTSVIPFWEPSARPPPATNQRSRPPPRRQR